MTVEAVIFDWGGTLTPWSSVEPRDGWLAFARAVHDDPTHVDALASALLGAEQKRWAAVLADHSAFTRQFKASTGFTPRQYRQATGGAEM